MIASTSKGPKSYEGAFLGAVGYVAIWPYVLTEAEIKPPSGHLSLKVGSTHDQPKLQFLMNEGQGWALSSSDGRSGSLTGTMFNGPYWQNFAPSSTAGVQNVTFNVNAETELQFFENGTEIAATGKDRLKFEVQKTKKYTFERRCFNDTVIGMQVESKRVVKGKSLGMVLASGYICNDIIKTTQMWMCRKAVAKKDDPDQHHWATRKYQATAAKGWANARVVGPNGMAPWIKFPDQNGLLIWDAKQTGGTVQCRTKLESSPHAAKTLHEFKTTRFTYKRLSKAAEKKCESWRCGVAKPIVSIVDVLPLKSKVHRELHPSQEGEYPLNGLCYVKEGQHLAGSNLLYTSEAGPRNVGGRVPLLTNDPSPF